MTSPFQFGREVLAGELVDREQELEEVLDVIAGATRLFLIGPRRFGKTSILTTAANLARERGDIVIQVNAELFASHEALAADIIRQAGEQLKSPLATAVAQIKTLFEALNPQITYNPLTDAWSVGITAKSAPEPTAYLTDALNSLDQLAQKVNRPVALIIDEFQQVVAEDGLLAERQLRAVIQTHRHVGYVLAGSAMTMLMAMTGDHSRPFYRLGSRRFLGAIPRDEFSVHILAGFAKAGLTITQEAATTILDLAEDVPYSVQRLADAVWRSALADKRSTTIDTPAINVQLEYLLDLEAPQYGAIVQQLTPIQIKALAAVAHIGQRALTSSKTARKFGLPQSSLRRGLEALVGRAIIRQVFDGEATQRFAFEDPFFGQWVRQRVKY